MDFLPENIDNYVLEHSQKEPRILQELSKETWQKVLNPRMLSGAYQGRVLSMISKLHQPKKILEIGTYTGYSALSLAEGLHTEGQIITIDKNEELETLQNKYFEKSGYRERIIQLVGDATKIIPTLTSKFDLVFIDADKSNYINYFHLIIHKMNLGGIILSDNVLWSGKVVEKLNSKDEDTKVLIEYNRLLNSDDRVETVLLPIRDGLTISRVVK
ncbi:O-methyltransferase [Polaribacter porphyrae]|uniref:Methyltransferase n=1 Tax=Polaribacter porphyrae TaxID=1137780 RepID=A0A2S7WQQ5_9FLAO|nr:class I SAM-dependent methyltransferase [Polaribacter porphyrae]PQJ79948.1 methyltransferase [Polaribacter porphyrae]